MLFGIGFPLVLSLKAMLIWLGLVLASATLASGVPAWKASRLPVHQSLSTL